MADRELNLQIQIYETSLISFEDNLSRTDATQQALAEEQARFRELSEWKAELDVKELQERKLSKCLSYQKPLCTKLAHFVGQIMSKKDKTSQVQSLGRGVTSIFDEILLQIGVFDVQANQLRVTNVQRPYTAAAASGGGRGHSRAGVVSKLQQQRAAAAR